MIIKGIQKRFLNRLLTSEAGRVKIALDRIRGLPEQPDIEGRQKANLFEKGLSNFVQRTLKKSWGPFKADFEEGQVFKKRAVIQLINVTASGQKKMYTRWNHIVNRQKLINECKQVNDVFATLNFTIKSIADNAFLDNKDNQIKEKALIQLFRNLHLNLGDSFRKWRENNAIITMNDRLSNTQKAALLKMLENLLGNDKNTKLKEVINKFRLNKNIIEIQRNFLKRLLMSKAGLVMVAFKKMQSLPEPLNLKERQKANLFEKGLSNFVQRTLKKSWGPFKADFEEGQVFKKRAVIQLINVTASGQKKMYTRWNHIVNRQKLINECKQVNDVFATLNFTIKSIADNAFLDNKDNQIKEKALIQLFRNLHLNLGDSFRKWRENNAIITMNDRLSNTQKAALLKMLENLLGNDKNTKLKEVINKFRLNKNIIEIQRNFLKRLLMSKAGLVMVAFKKMQSLPEPLNLKERQKANLFEKGLSNFVQRTLKKSWGPFKADFEEGQVFKKRAVIQLINVTASGQKKMYTRWNHIVNRQKLINECKQVNDVFATLNFTIKSIADNAFLDNKDNQIKEKALIQLFRNLHLNLGDSFRKWRENNAIITMNDRLSNTQKAALLKMLENLLGNDKNTKLKEVINKFRLNKNIIEIQRNFLKRLLMSKAGLVMVAFKKMQSLPEPLNLKERQKANLFEKGLSNFVQRTLKKSWGPFKADFEEGQVFKKRAVIQLINVTASGQKKMYTRWNHIVNRQKLINECKQVNDVFATLNFTIKSIADNAFLDNKDNQIKEKALIQLFRNLHLNLGDSFRKWRENNAIITMNDRLSNTQKAALLKMLENLLGNDKNTKLKEVINKFRLNKNIIEIQRNFLKRLLMSKAGLVMVAFKKMQSLPEPLNLKERQKANLFEKGLSNFVQRTLKKSWGPFKADFEEGQVFKKRAVIQLINVTASGQKKMYTRWNHIVNRQKLINECKQVNDVFATLNFTIKSIADNAFLDNKDNQIKEKALIQLFRNLHLNLGDSFRKWRENNAIITMNDRLSNTQKAALLKMLENLLGNDKNTKLKEVINKFRLNKNIIEIQRNFLKRLLMSKAGLVMVAFKKMQSLPEPLNLKERQKANLFEKGLSNFVQRTLKKSWGPFKADFEEGQVFKKRAVIQLINVTASGQKKMYTRWNHIVNRQKLINECKQVNDVFATLNFTIKSIADNAFLDNKDNQIKEKALIQLFRNLHLNLGDSFRKWRENNAIITMNDRLSNTQKAALLKMLENLLGNDKNTKLKEVINKFRLNKNIIEIQRNFLKRLLMSKAGLVMVAFKKMQSLPEPLNLKERQKANLFEKGLSNFVQRTLKKSWGPFKADFEEGQVFKKRAVIQLINVTASGQKKMYTRWNHIVNRQKLINECKQVNDVFATLNFTIKSIADNAFLDNKDNQIKEKALIQLFRNLHLNLGDSFRKWRENNAIITMNDRLSNTQKAALLKMLENLLGNDKNTKLKEVINKFRLNKNIIEIQRNFLKRLLMSKAGLVMVAFKKMQSLPEPLNLKERQKANLFEKGLSNFVQRTLKKSWGPFKADFEEGQVFKKRAVIQLINVTASGQKKMYTRWNHIVNRQKLINECKQVNDVFATLNFTIKSIADNAFLDNKDNQIKEKALIQLFRNLHLNLGDSFRKWRENNAIITMNDRLSNTQKAALLKMLENLLGNDKNTKLKEVINKFRLNKNIIEIQRNFLKRLLMSKAGLVMVAFKKMQSLPEPLNLKERQKANLFEKGLSNFVQRTLKKSWGPFKADFEEGQVFKKRAVIQLINVTASGQKKMYTRWNHIVNRQKLINECKQVNDVFATLNFTIKSIADNAFLDNKDNQIKEKALIQLFRNLHLNLGDSFRKWRENNAIITMNDRLSNTQKAALLKMLENLLGNDKNTKLKEVINKFRLNKNIIEIQRNFLKRLLMSKAGLVMVAFKKMQSLPEPLNLKERQKANLFEKGLSNFVQRTLKKSWGPFKADFEEGQVFKKRAVIQLINVTASGQKKMYTRWNHIVNRQKLME
jgi:hypothetical protein